MPAEPDYVACHAMPPNVDLQSCVREQGHDGPHRYWSGVNVSGGRKSALWLYEPQDDGGLKPVCHGDFAGHYTEDFAIFLSVVIDASADPGKHLPPEERKAYEDAQQSVVDARRSAERNEGQRWIG